MPRHLKLVAVVAVVLAAISGFSPARKGGGHRSGGSGGGCSSSSSSSHNSSNDAGSDYGTGSKDGYGSDGGRRSSRRYHSTTGTTGAGNGAARNGAASGTVTRCAAQSGSEAKAVVEVRNPKSYSKTYRVKVKFLDGAGAQVDSGLAKVEVGGRDTEPVDVRMGHPERVGDVSECLVESVS
ncbi:hypothetical protein [Streptomyces winkii]|uniref:hypothetical protein n=1 Tax=Streptomyces winkii TaxID=3051178 RepID=UPI0028D6E1A9|nr:hypothetical protein [Streptomyces sp. DSM 40971]